MMATFTRRRYRVTLAMLVALSIIIAGCTRSATSGTLPTATPETGGGADATMEALRASMLTQTQTTILGLGGGGEEVTPTPSETPTPGPTETPVPTETLIPTGPQEYSVQPGDWLYKIARDHGVDPQAIIAANPGIDPNHIEAGQVLKIPAPGQTVSAAAATAVPGTYVVKPGDWIYKIARELGKDPKAIIAANPGIETNRLIPGQVLNIP